MTGSIYSKRDRCVITQSNQSSVRPSVRPLNVSLSKHAPFTSALSNTHDILKGLQETMLLPELDDQLLCDLSAERAYVSDELDMLRASAASLKQELEDIWRDEHEAVYELTSVFIHRGATPQWGHYFFYSRHLPENPDSWFKYNDSEVSVVPKDEVLANSTGSTANPYMVRLFPRFFRSHRR